MDSQTQTTLTALLVLLIALLQFLLHRASQSDAVKELEVRLAEAEQRLEDILKRLGS